MKKFFSLMLLLSMVMFVTSAVYADSKDVNDEYLTEIELKEEGTIKVTKQQQKVSNIEINEAYERVQREERYIVSLINSLEENTVTNQENWKFNLNYLKKNYSYLNKKHKDGDTKINLFYIDSYIEAYEYVLLDERSPKEKKNLNRALISDTNYTINDAVDYANTYYSNYNISYPNWSSYGGDCANFVSQSLYAGGKSMVGTPGTSSSAQDFSNWFSTGSSNNTKNVSSTWRGADAFKHYWKANALSYKTFTSFSSSTTSYAYRGDAVSLLTSNGRAYHTLIIVGYDSGDLVYAAHTGNTNTGSLQSISNDFIIYNMKYSD